MKMQTKSIYHGAALCEIVDHESFKALNRAKDQKYGHYEINTGIFILIKHTKKTESPWKHNFNAKEIQLLMNDLENATKTFVGLVCSKTAVCLLNQEQIKHLLDFENNRKKASITVVRPKNGSFHVKSQFYKCKRTISKTDFPNDIFE